LLMKFEPRLTAIRGVNPTSTGAVLVEWTRDLDEELEARCHRLSDDQLKTQFHPDLNSVAVTVWHVARWLDVVGTRFFTSKPASAEVWHEAGWLRKTGYDPSGIGYQGLGVLTGYTPEQMRSVPALDGSSLAEYLRQSASRLIEQIGSLGARLFDQVPNIGVSPYQVIGATLQGGFGHVGEIDALVALGLRLTPLPKEPISSQSPAA
jgi:hypothetical protein